MKTLCVVCSLSTSATTSDRRQMAFTRCMPTNPWSTCKARNHKKSIEIILTPGPFASPACAAILPRWHFCSRYSRRWPSKHQLASQHRQQLRAQSLRHLKWLWCSELWDEDWWRWYGNAKYVHSKFIVHENGAGKEMVWNLNNTFPYFSDMQICHQCHLRLLRRRG